MKRRQFIIHAGTLVAVVASHKGFTMERSRKDLVPYTIKQFKDEGLAHFSYAVSTAGNVILIDPGRDPQPYYDHAKILGATITAVVETHPHADFISSHAEIQQKVGATVYVSDQLSAQYPHHPLADGHTIRLSEQLQLKTLFTPGHSPDSISLVLQYKDQNVAVFSGDALLFGDVGRPDLRAYSGDYATEKTSLARQMYHTIHEKFSSLEDDVILYPAHGAGSLCGNAIRNVSQSTIGYEKTHNYAFEQRSEDEFVSLLLRDHPPIPPYFPYDVELNKKGALPYLESIGAVHQLSINRLPKEEILLIDTRTAERYKRSHLVNSINIMDGTKFETWLGSIVKPDQKFMLVTDGRAVAEKLVKKTAKIGYELNIEGFLVYDGTKGLRSDEVDQAEFIQHKDHYTIIDVRSEKEVSEKPIFKEALNIPLTDLPSKIDNLITDKPIIVHCASGYRSAIGSSLIKKRWPLIKVYDLGSQISAISSQAECKQ